MEIHAVHYPSAASIQWLVHTCAKFSDKMPLEKTDPGLGAAHHDDRSRALSRLSPDHRHLSALNMFPGHDKDPLGAEGSLLRAVFLVEGL